MLSHNNVLLDGIIICVCVITVGARDLSDLCLFFDFVTI